MGCEKFRDEGMGVGGVRASMERRWLINAKTTVMRQRKWQEVRMQKEEEEMKKVAEILEKRKRERARLAAYIHRQPVRCIANATKCTRNETKRSNWNTCLMEDQELIMRLREKSAVAQNSYSQRTNNTADTLWQGSERVQQCGAYTTSYRKGFHAPGHNLSMGTKYIDDTTYESYSHLERDHHDSDQLSEVSAAKFSIKSEPVRSTCWALDVPTYASLAEETRSQPLAKTKRSSAMTCEERDEYPATDPRFENLVQPPAKKSNHQVISKLIDTYAEAYSAPTTLVAFGQRKSNLEPSCDLRGEILKARQANEVATARLIAEVSAIESRLEECNLSLKPLDFREAEPEGVNADLNKYTSYTDPLCSDSCGETDSNFSSDSDDGTSGSFPKSTADRNYDSQGKPQHKRIQPCKQVIYKSIVAAASDPLTSLDSDWNFLTVGTPKTCHEMEMGNTETKPKSQEKSKPEDKEATQQSTRKVTPVDSLDQTSSEIDWNLGAVTSPDSYTKLEGNGFQATREACTYHKVVIAVNEGSSLEISDVKLAPSVSTRKDSLGVWEIDWDTPKERWLNKRMDCYQSKQQISLPSMTERGEWKVPAKKNSNQQQLSEDTDSLRDQRQRIESCSRRPPILPDGGGNNCRPQVELPNLPLYHQNLGISQPWYRSCMQTQSLHPSYRQVENTIHENFRRSMRRIDSSPDKENYRKSQSGALIEEEEEKIFASLERLDWKLAALYTRSVSTGRDSFASQGEFSTKSAPAVMGPSIKKLGHGGVHYAKKPISYSSVPPRSLTPQSHRPPTGSRRRRQVGLTNKCAGKNSHCCPKYPAGTSKDNSGHSDLGSEKCQSSRGTIVCHKIAHQLFDTALAC